MTELRVQLPPLRRTVLPNGLTIVVIERRSLPLVTLHLTTLAGGACEPGGNPELAAFTARMMRRGAGEWNAELFSEEIDFLGADLGATAGLDQLWLSAEFTSDALERGLELYTAALLRPRFDEHELERERGRAIAEVVQARDDADHVADEAFVHFLFGAHPYGRCAAASANALQALQREDLVRYHAERISPDGAVLLVVGDVDRDGFLAKLETALAGWTGAARPDPPPDAERPAGRRVVLVDHPSSSQLQYRCGTVGVRRTVEDWHALLVANTVLGGGFTSRLVDQLRVERGLTYTAYSRFAAGRSAGPFTVATHTRNEELQTLHDVVQQELRSFAELGPSDEETNDAKSYLVGTQPSRVETARGLAMALAEAELFGLGHEAVTEYRRDVLAVSRDEATAAARRALPVEDPFTVLVGDADSLSAAAEQLGELTVVPLDFAEKRVAAS